MRQRNLIDRLMASTAVALSSIVVSVASAGLSPVYAQDYTSGTVSGTVRAVRDMSRVLRQT